jgi:hypothetical protein
MFEVISQRFDEPTNETITLSLRRRGRVAEGGGLLNRYTLQRRIEGSNPSVSANDSIFEL